MKKRQLLLVMIMLFTLVVATQVSFAQGRSNRNSTQNTNGNNGGNADCPAGTTEVAKFNYNNGSYVLESGGGVTINGNASGGTWSSTYFISHIVVKGGPAHYIAVIVPAAQSGTFTNFGLPLVGNGNTPGISNIKFCAGEQPPPPTGDCITAIRNGQLAITGMSDNNVTFNYQITNTSAFKFNVGAASYQVYTTNPDTVITTQTLFHSQEKEILPGQTVTVSVNTPSCAHQVDVFCGPLITQFGPEPGQGYYGERKIIGMGFEGYFYGPRPVGSWVNNLCPSTTP